MTTASQLIVRQVSSLPTPSNGTALEDTVTNHTQPLEQAAHLLRRPAAELRMWQNQQAELILDIEIQCGKHRKAHIRPGIYTSNTVKLY